MLLLFILLGVFFIGSVFLDVAIDEDDERQVAIARNLTLISGTIMMAAVFSVAILL